MPKPADLLEYEDPRFIALSPDGETVVLKTRRAVVDSNDHTTTLWKIPTDGSGISKLNLPEGARDMEWLPDSKRIAYLAPTKSGQQVWIKRLGTNSATQVTSRKGGVRDLSISPDGKQIAYTVAKRTSQISKEQNPSWWKGVEVNQRNFRCSRIFMAALERPLQILSILIAAKNFRSLKQLTKNLLKM